MALITPIPTQDTNAKQPLLSDEVRALLSTAGCTWKYQGSLWMITRNGKSYALGSTYSSGASFDDWKAAVHAVVEATKAAV